MNGTPVLSGVKEGDLLEGLIFNIQRYSLQDGPGIRTTVFFKGCPLRCTWCSNPESQDPDPEIMHRSLKCQGCGECVQACPRKAIKIEEGKARIDRAICDRCLKCAEACLNGALETTGKRISVGEAVHECCQDEPFYRNSGGGVTLSGGEPLFQPAFALRLLKACKEKSLGTVLDTCGYAPWEVVEEILTYTDLILFDLKHLDPERHRKGTGRGNDLILGNLKRIFQSEGTRIWIRIPLISGYNDSEEYAGEVARTLARGRVEKVSLLPYHEWGRPKYGFLGRTYPFNGPGFIDQDRLETIKTILEAEGLPVTIGH